MVKTLLQVWNFLKHPRQNSLRLLPFVTNFQSGNLGNTSLADNECTFTSRHTSCNVNLCILLDVTFKCFNQTGCVQTQRADTEPKLLACIQYFREDSSWCVCFCPFQLQSPNGHTFMTEETASSASLQLMGVIYSLRTKSFLELSLFSAKASDCFRHFASQHRPRPNSFFEWLVVAPSSYGSKCAFYLS